MQINTPLCKINEYNSSPGPRLSQALGFTFTKGVNLRLLELPPNEAVSCVKEKQTVGCVAE